MNYTTLPQQLQCNECKQTQLATNKYCCNCGVKFVKGLDYDKEACKEAADRLGQLTRYPAIPCSVDDFFKYVPRNPDGSFVVTSCIGTSREVLAAMEKRERGDKPSMFDVIASTLGTTFDN